MASLHPRIQSRLIVFMTPLVATCGSDPTTTSDIIASISVTPTSSVVTALGLTQQFLATAQDAAGNTLTEKAVTWRSSSTGVATINELTGVATAVGNGTATITATAEGISGSAILEVEQTVAAVSLVVNTTTLTAFGQTAAITAKAVDAKANEVANASISWSSSDPSVVEMSSPGLVTAVSNGSARITATAGGTSGAIDIIVSQVATQLSVSLQPSPTAVSGVPFAQQPAVRLLDANGNAARQAGWVVHAAIATGGGVLSGTTVIATDTLGTASFEDLAITGTAGTRTLSFSSGGLSAVSTGIDITTGTVLPRSPSQLHR